MLQIIRDKTSGWVASAIMGLLIIPFAFWGINYYFSGGQEPIVASVNGKEIKLTQFQRTFTNYRQQMQTTLGQTFGPGEDALLKQQTLDYMVESELLNDAIRAAGLYASDERIRETIKNIEVFKGETGFNKDMYQQSIARLGMPPAQYEEQMRLDMMSEQLQSAIIDSEFVSAPEATEVARLEHQQRDLTYTIIPADRIKETLQVSAAEVEKFYQDNPRLYVKPEEVSITYLQLRQEDLAAAVVVNEEDLRAYYTDNKADYDAEEQRKLTQILVKTEDTARPEKIEAAEKEVNAILAQIRSGKTFEDIAKAYADNKDANFSISEYGFLAKGLLEKEVEAVAFSMQKDEISDVIKSKLGFHIIRLEDIKGGVMNTFENNRENVERDYRHAQSEQRFFDLADRLATTSYEHPDTLEIAAEETGLVLQQSELFSRNGGKEGITANPKVSAASFSEDVLLNAHNSEVLEITDSDLVVVRVNEHAQEARRPLTEVRDEIINDIKFSRASAQTAEIGQQVLADLKAGKTFDTIAGEQQLEWKEVKAIQRTDVSINRAILRAAFNLGHPEQNQPVTGGIALGTGDYAVVAVLAVNDPVPDSIKQVEVEKMQKQLQAYRSASSWQQYLHQLKSGADITVFKDRLQ